MSPGDVRILIDYHYWARDRMLEAVEAVSPDQYTRDMGNSFRSIRDTVVHTFSAESIWLSLAGTLTEWNARARGISGRSIDSHRLARPRSQDARILREAR